MRTSMWALRLRQHVWYACLRASRHSADSPSTRAGKASRSADRGQAYKREGVGPRTGSAMVLAHLFAASANVQKGSRAMPVSACTLFPAAPDRRVITKSDCCRTSSFVWHGSASQSVSDVIRTAVPVTNKTPAHSLMPEPMSIVATI